MYQLSSNSKFTSIFRDKAHPVLLFASEIMGNPKWKHPMHKHEDMCELVLIIDGKGHYVINNKKYTAEKGDLLIYNRGILHDESSDPQNTINTYVLGINNVFIEGLEDLTIIPATMKPIIDVRESFDKFKYDFHEIIEECLNKKLYFEEVCQGILANIIIHINRIISSGQGDQIDVIQSELVVKVKDYIDNNYMNNIKLEDLSAEFHFSTSYLCHAFKKELSFSPIDYLIQRRIGEAQKLLLSSKLSINEIAERVGYPNVNYFAMVFKKATSVSPGEFREFVKVDK